MPVTTAAQQWAEALQAWRVPDEILAGTDASPWLHDVRRFADRADLAETMRSPATERAVAALSQAGDETRRGVAGMPGEVGYPRRSVSVLDVGCGAGAATTPLLPLVTEVTGVDEDPAMLAAFLERVVRGGIEERVVEGRWPDVADRVGVADLVVCHDVLYNVPDIAPFVHELTAHARRRVVVVVPERHPQTWTAPYWRELHGLERPDSPTAADLLAVLGELGLSVSHEHYPEATWWASADEDDLVSTVSRRLCLDPSRAADVRAAVRRHGAPAERTAVAVWWDGGATSPGRLF